MASAGLAEYHLRDRLRLELSIIYQECFRDQDVKSMRYRLRITGAAAAAAVAVMVVCWVALAHVGGGSGEPPSVDRAAARACADNGLGERLGMANPAATYCRELGYEYRIARDAQGEEGICVFPDGKECEEWKFLAGKCGRERSYCAQQGFDVVTKTNGKNSLSREYAECVSDGQEIGSVSDLMGLSQKATKGSVPLTEIEPSQGEAPVTEAPPSSFDWRDQGGVNWLTSVKNQGGCGSCWAFSTVGVVESAYNVQSGNPDIDLDLSEEYLVSYCYTMGPYGNCCGGSYEDALQFVQESGIPDEACMTYVDLTGCTCGSSCDSNCTYRTGGACSDAACSDRCPDWQSRSVTIDGAAPVPSGQMKQYLISKGPLAVAMGVGSVYGGAFDGQGVYRCTNDTGANHAVIVVGYNDSGGYWIVKNSWGAAWGADGYFNVGYGECAIETWPYYVDAPIVPVPSPTPCVDDVDCDGAPDSVDNCPAVYNPDQLNSDAGRRPNGPHIPGDWASNPAQDRLGDACDPDNDNDALPDSQESDTLCPYRLVADSDGDTVMDGYEVTAGYDPCDSASKPTWSGGFDSDGDSLTDGIERGGYNTCAFTGDTVPGWTACANPVDSDGDGCADILEVLDINGDRVSSVGDITALARRSSPIPWPGFEPDPVSDKVYDVNKDGVISIGDLSLMAMNTCLEKPELLGCPVCAPE